MVQLRGKGGRTFDLLRSRFRTLFHWSGAFLFLGLLANVVVDVFLEALLATEIFLLLDLVE